MRRLVLAATTALSLSLVGCTTAPVFTPMEFQQAVDRSYGGNWDAYVRDNWSVVADNIVQGNRELVLLMQQNGVSADPDWAPRASRPAVRLVDLVVATGDPGDQYLQMIYWLLDNGHASARDARYFQVALYRKNPKILALALRHSPVTFSQCAGEAACEDALIDLGAGFAALSGDTSGAANEMRGLMMDFINNPANAQKLAAMGLNRESALALARTPTPRTQTAQASQQQSSGGGGMGVFGSILGSAVGGLIGGEEGQIFDNTFSSIMAGASQAESGGDVFGSTLAALGQGSGLMDADTAGIVGMAGGLFSAGPGAQQVTPPQSSQISSQITNQITAPVSSSQGMSSAADRERDCLLAGGQVEANGRCTQLIPDSDFNRAVIAQRQAEARAYYGISETSSTSASAGAGFSSGSGQSGVSAQQAAAVQGMENYSFSCPHGSGPHQVVLPTENGAQCTAAARQFAYAATCNLVDEMMAAQSNYYQTCLGFDPTR